MREIKFRAWAATDEGLGMVYFDKLECDNGLWFTSPIVHIDDYSETIMQYIGLKDMNGKEIYEGDIVKYQHSKGSQEYIGDVYFKTDFASFVIRSDEKGGWFSLLGQQKVISVIGNIYENPELLPK